MSKHDCNVTLCCLVVFFTIHINIQTWHLEQQWIYFYVRVVFWCESLWIKQQGLLSKAISLHQLLNNHTEKSNVRRGGNCFFPPTPCGLNGPECNATTGVFWLKVRVVTVITASPQCSPHTSALAVVQRHSGKRRKPVEMGAPQKTESPNHSIRYWWRFMTEWAIYLWNVMIRSQKAVFQSPKNFFASNCGLALWKKKPQKTYKSVTFSLKLNPFAEVCCITWILSLWISQGSHKRIIEWNRFLPLIISVGVLDVQIIIHPPFDYWLLNWFEKRNVWLHIYTVYHSS